MTLEPRDISGDTVAIVLRYVRQEGGDGAVAEVVARTHITEDPEALQDPSNWISLDAGVRLLESAASVLGDPHAPFKAGATAASYKLHPAIAPLVNFFGSPREIYRELPRALPKITRAQTMDVTELSATSATIQMRMRDGYLQSRLTCDFTQGMLSAAPTVFGLPPAHITHEQCEADGYPACVYQLTWLPRRRWWSPRSPRPTAAFLNEVARRDQAQAFQLAAADLVSSDDVEEVLERIVSRAAAAVLAPAYLVVVEGTNGEEPLIRYRGLDDERAADLALRLLAGDDLHDFAVVVDIASRRRVHGRLAAIYSSGHREMSGDKSLLEAYARHAAATLDLVTALDESRHESARAAAEAARAAALLALAHELAMADSALAVAEVVTAAVPGIVGCRAAAFLLWDQSIGTLRAIAWTGTDPAKRDQLLNTPIRVDQTPELVMLLTQHQPILITSGTASPPLAHLLAIAGSECVMGVPLLAGDTLMGVVVATWDAEARIDLESEAFARIEGVSGQAATALQNARLIATVRDQSLHDALTGLSNRVLFAQELDTTLRGSLTNTITAVMFCDLDNFKQVNDDFGHGAGDELLRQVAARLRSLVRPGDIVGRLGGDEFGVVISNVLGHEAANDRAHLIVETLNQPFHIAGHDLRVSASVGVALHTGSDGHGERLLAAADTAMYSAKERGRNQVAFAGDATAARTGPSLQAELMAALEHHEMRLYFQPVIDLSGVDTCEMVGAEALIRWDHPRLGLLPPAAFLPLAEETGFITELDLWVTGAACEALAGWPQSHGRALHVAVNLASATLGDPRLLPTVRTALKRNNLTPERLVLELVESRSLNDLPGVVDRLTELRQLGVRISLDDFGTGYSTLTWLSTLPIDQIKIDRSFVMTLPDDASCALVRGVLALTRELGVEVVAEGVETPDQLSALRKVGCTTVQGFLLGRPVPQLFPSRVPTAVPILSDPNRPPPTTPPNVTRQQPSGALPSSPAHDRRSAS